MQVFVCDTLRVEDAEIFQKLITFWIFSYVEKAYYLARLNKTSYFATSIQ